MVALVQLKDLGDVIDAAARAIGTFADSIGRAASLSLKGYDEVAARRDEARLRNLYVQLVEYMAGQGTYSSRLTDYVRDASSRLERSKGAMTPDDVERLTAKWAELMGRVGVFMGVVERLLREWRRERSELVLEKEYTRILEALHGRVALFEALGAMEPPMKPDEIEAADEIAKRWLHLYTELRRANRELALFLKGRD